MRKHFNRIVIRLMKLLHLTNEFSKLNKQQVLLSGSKLTILGFDDEGVTMTPIPRCVFSPG